MGDATQRFKHNHGLIQNQSTARSHTRTPFRSGSEPHYLRMVKHRLFWAKWPFLTICLMGFNLHFGENHSNAGQHFPRQTFPIKATTFHQLGYNMSTGKAHADSYGALQVGLRCSQVSSTVFNPTISGWWF